MFDFREFTNAFGQRSPIVPEYGNPNMGSHYDQARSISAGANHHQYDRYAL